MAGNVREWTHTVFDSYPYLQSDEREANGSVDRTSDRVIRGGVWIGELDAVFRLTARDHIYPDFSYLTVGFRCVRDYEGAE